MYVGKWHRNLLRSDTESASSTSDMEMKYDVEPTHESRKSSATLQAAKQQHVSITRHILSIYLLYTIQELQRHVLVHKRQLGQHEDDQTDEHPR